MLSEHELIVERPDGTIDESEGVPFEVDDLLNELRKVMYTPGAGSSTFATFHETTARFQTGYASSSPR